MQELEGLALTKEQSNMVGKGYAGPPVSVDSVQLSSTQVPAPYALCQNKILPMELPADAKQTSLIG